MVMQRDFLDAGTVKASGSTNDLLNQLLAEQSDYLALIAQHMRESQADVLTQVVVERTSQIGLGTVTPNTIVDLFPHEVRFQLAGKPVLVYKTLIWSTYTKTIGVSVVRTSSSLDGMQFTSTTPPLILDIPVNELYVHAAALTVANTLSVNGGSADGGLYIYGFTIPDYDQIRGSRRD